MAKLLTTLSACIILCFSYAQTTLLYEDFESGMGTWTIAGDLTPNTWIANSCAGNGTTSMYITKGGSIPGCGATGTEQYAYENAPTGTHAIISHTTVNANCMSSLSATFDYRLEGVTSEDYAELVYSTNGGGSWSPIGAALPMSSNWTNTTIALPALLNSTVFEIGIRFTYNDATINGFPIAIDEFSVTGSDEVAPSIICPSVTPIYLDASCDGLIPDYTSSAFVTDNCLGTPSVTQTPAPGTSVNITDSPTIQLTATDAAGNQSMCSFTQTIFDTTSPIISCPGTQSEYLNISCLLSVPDYTSMAVSSDNCEAFGALTISQAPLPGVNIGDDATITITAEDASGNSSSCNFTLQAIDTISPTISCPSPITVSTTTGCTHLLTDYTGVAIANDNCAFGPLTLTQSPIAGTSLNTGVNTITITAMDVDANTKSCTFDLTVEDQEAPIITTCAPNQNVIVNNACEGALGDYTSLLIVSDNCTALGNLTFTQSPTSGTTITANSTVTITVTDENNNSTNCQFTAILADTTSPIVTCPADINEAINSNCEYNLSDVTAAVTGTDNCSVLANMTITQNPLPGTLQNGITNILITLADEQGNTSTCTLKAIPNDIDPPTITCPSAISENIGTACDFTVPYYGGSALVLDNCSNYTIDQTPPVGTIINAGTNTITLLVTDAGGNTDQCSFVLEVTETQVPTINCPSDISTCDPVVTYSDPTFNDNCIAILSQTDLTGLSSGSTFPVGITTLEYTVADSSDNTQTCSFNVEVLDYPSPANIQEDTIRLCDQSSTLLSADAITSGNGLWTVISGQGSFNNQFANITGVNNIATGINSYEWAVSSPSCGTLRDTVVIINSQEDLPASTQDTLYACSDGSVILQANAPLYGTGTWTTNGNATIDDINDASTTASVQHNGWHNYVWTITSGGCPSTSDTLRVFSMLKPTINIGDTSLCLENDLIQVSGPALVDGQTVSWTMITGNAIIDYPYETSTEVSSFDHGINELLLTVDHPECDPLFDTMKIIGSLCDGFKPILPTVITPGNLDGRNDVFTIDFLDALYPDCRVTIFNRWGSIVYESVGYEKPWDGRYNGENLPMGTYFYRIELLDEDNTVLKGDISIIH